jgi:hypothetical protein
MPATEQTKSNHVRLDPSFHFFLLPVTFLVIVWSVIHAFRHLSTVSAALLLLAVLLLWTALKARSYALRVQDRVIRLEERLRLALLLPAPIHIRIPELTESQLVALRFACDAEVPDLTARALSERLTSKQIKEAIRTWRPDYFRI